MSNLQLEKSNFIHIPKCAGTYVQSLIYKIAMNVKKRYDHPHDGHLFLHQMPDYNKYYNFTFVRHPYTWWPSFYTWCKKDRFSLQERECENFDVWVKDFGPFWMGHYTRLVKRYTGDDPTYLVKKKIDFVGKVENLVPDVKTALLQAGEVNIGEKYFSEEYFDEVVKNAPNDPNMIKWRNEQTYDKGISDQSKEIIYKTERYVFERFNYNQ